MFTIKRLTNNVQIPANTEFLVLERGSHSVKAIKRLFGVIKSGVPKIVILAIAFKEKDHEWALQLIVDFIYTPGSLEILDLRGSFFNSEQSEVLREHFLASPSLIFVMTNHWDVGLDMLDWKAWRLNIFVLLKASPGSEIRRLPKELIRELVTFGPRL